MFALSAGALLAQAPGPLTVEQRLEIIRTGKNHPGQIQTLRVAGDATVGGSVAPAAGVILPVVGATAITNGQAYTVIWGKVNKLHAMGQATGLTNTITLANTAGNVAASDVGKVTYLVNHFYASNSIAIDIDGNLYGPANVVLKEGAGVLLIPIATNEVYVIER